MPPCRLPISGRLPLLAAIGLMVPWCAGCHLYPDRVAPEFAFAATRALYSEDHGWIEEFDEDIPAPRDDSAGAPGGAGEVILGELIAIFPGFFVQGLGHRYAGDYRTASQLGRVGQIGMLLTLLGGGIVTGGYFAEDADQTSLGISLYASGGFIGAVGVTYWGTAWIYDIIDTPRAILSGGRPPPRSTFVESLDVFGD